MAKYDLNDREIQHGHDRVMRFALWEKQYSTYKQSNTLGWERILAKKAHRRNLPTKQGVYAFVVRPEIAQLDFTGYILYVGQTENQNFKVRFGQYLSEGRRGKPRLWVKEMFRRWKHKLFYYYAEMSSIDAAACEEALLSALLPPYNEKFPGNLSKIKKEIYR